MKINISKDSLLVRMIFYNNIAIVLVSVTIALFLTFIAFQDIESQVVTKARDKIVLANKGYNAEMFKAKEDLIKAISMSSKTDIFYETRPYWRQVDILKRELNIIDINDYNNSIIAICNAKGQVLAENTNLPMFSDIDQKFFRENIGKENGILKNNYLFKINDRIYSRIVVKYPGKNLYYLLTLPLDRRSLKEFSELAGLEKDDKIFVYSGNTYISGTFAKMDKTPTNILTYRRLISRGHRYYYKKLDINNKAYFVILRNLYDYQNKLIGTLGVGIYYEDIELMKMAIVLVVVIIVLLFVVISSTVSTKIMKKLLKPLDDIMDATNKISNGDYNIDIKPKGVDELRTLSNTFNKMARYIRQAQRKNHDKEEILKGSLRRINSIEKILMNIQITDAMEETISDIMKSLVSEMGLNYSRAMYFRYSREIDKMVGEEGFVNLNILRNFSNEQGFKFQVTELKSLIKLIKIPFKKDNLVARALIEKRIISYNAKGYKMTLGNELFNSLGIRNFMIIPIYSEMRNYGCILVDYFGTKKTVSKEEIELLTVLYLNIAVRIRNKTLENERIELDRISTVGKLIDRIFVGQEISLDKILFYLDKITKDSKEDLKIPISEIKNLIEKLNLSQERLFEYSNYENIDKNLEIIDLDKLLSEVVDEYIDEFLKDRISISLFVNCDVLILGNKNRLRQAFVEIIKNSYESFRYKKDYDEDKKINITVTKAKDTSKVTIHIIDNGCGMDEEALNKIFEPFVSYNNTTSGIGLSLVSRIIKDHGGVIKYSSVIDEGTNVKITLNIFKEEIL